MLIFKLILDVLTDHLMQVIIRKKANCVQGRLKIYYKCSNYDNNIDKKYELHHYIIYFEVFVDFYFSPKNT